MYAQFHPEVSCEEEIKYQENLVHYPLKSEIIIRRCIRAETYRLAYRDLDVPPWVKEKKRFLQNIKIYVTKQILKSNKDWYFACMSVLI